MDHIIKIMKLEEKHSEPTFKIISTDCSSTTEDGVYIISHPILRP